MTSSGDAATSGWQRTWPFVAAAAWGVLGLSWIAADRVALGCSSVALGLLHLLATRMPRFAAFMDAPLFRRKRSHPAA